MSKVVALSGWKRSGKDSAVEYLVENHGFKRQGFADALKDSVSKEFQISRNDLDNPATKERPLLDFPVEPKDEFTTMLHRFMVREFRTNGGYAPDTGYVKIENGKMQTWLFDKWEQLYQTPRSLAILKGSVNRSVQSDYWVTKVVENIYNNPFANFAISDLRYRSEVEQLRKSFGDSLTTIRIERFDTNPSTDPSENDLDDTKFDYVVKNKGTKEELFAQLKEIATKLQTN